MSEPKKLWFIFIENFNKLNFNDEPIYFSLEAI